MSEFLKSLVNTTVTTNNGWEVAVQGVIEAGDKVTTVIWSHSLCETPMHATSASQFYRWVQQATPPPTKRCAGSKGRG